MLGATPGRGLQSPRGACMRLKVKGAPDHPRPPVVGAAVYKLHEAVRLGVCQAPALVFI